MDVLDIIYTSAKSIVLTLPIGIHEYSDINSMIHYLLPDEVKVTTTIKDLILRSNLTTKETMRFTIKSFS